VIIRYRPAPLRIVVRAILVGGYAPPAPGQAIRTGDDAIGERWHGGHDIRELPGTSTVELPHAGPVRM